MPAPYPADLRHCPSCGGMLTQAGVSVEDRGDGVQTLKPGGAYWCERCIAVIEDDCRLDAGHSEPPTPHFRRDALIED